MNKDQLMSVAKGAGIAAAGAALTYLSQWASNTDFGSASVVVAAILSVATNAVRKWVDGMRDFWTNRKQQATDIVSERITVRYRQLIEEAVRRLIEEELEGAGGRGRGRGGYA